MPLARRAAAEYGDGEAERLRAAAEPLRGARILHLAAAGSRLRSPELVPVLLGLYRDVGLDAEYRVLAGDEELWHLVRQLEDGLQGGETAIDDGVWSQYLEAAPTVDAFDAVVVHGPGPLGVRGGQARVWRCEPYCSSADAAAMQRLRPLADGCAAATLPAAAYAPPGLESKTVEIPEAIDPLAPGALDLPVRLAGSMLRSLGVDTSHPCCCQVRPFDTWQDPQDVLDAFAIARDELPGLQLVMAGDPARGDVEAWRLLREVSDYADSHPGVLLVTEPGRVELGALRALSRVVLESALAPASTVTTLEALWKGTPVVAAGAGGDENPVEESRHGFVTDAPEDMAKRLVELVGDPGLAVELGRAGHEVVRERHLITQLAENELRLLATFQSA
jgi:trehalose synthase